MLQSCPLLIAVTSRPQADPHCPLKCFFFNINLLTFGYPRSLLLCMGYSLAVVHGLLVSVAFLISEHRHWSAGSVVIVHRLSCPMAGEIFPDQGLDLRPLHWEADSQPLNNQGSPSFRDFYLVHCLDLLTSTPGLIVLGKGQQWESWPYLDREVNEVSGEEVEAKGTLLMEMHGEQWKV